MKKQLPLGQDEAQGARALGPFPLELWQPSQVGFDRRCKAPNCLSEWNPAIPRHTERQKDKLGFQVSLIEGVWSLKKVWVPADCAMCGWSFIGNSWFGLLKVWAKTDGAIFDAGISKRGFYSPRIERYSDLAKQDVTLASGQYTRRAIAASGLSDAALTDILFSSGIYRSVVVTASSLTDKSEVDATFGSGTYTLRVVLAGAPATDKAMSDVTLASGVFTLRVVLGPPVTDKFSLDVGLQGGTYA